MMCTQVAKVQEMYTYNETLIKSSSIHLQMYTVYMARNKTIARSILRTKIIQQITQCNDSSALTCLIIDTNQTIHFGTGKGHDHLMQ